MLSFDRINFICINISTHILSYWFFVILFQNLEKQVNETSKISKIVRIIVNNHKNLLNFMNIFTFEIKSNRIS